MSNYNQQTIKAAINRTLFASVPRYNGILQDPVVQIHNGISSAIIAIGQLILTDDVVFVYKEDELLIKVAAIEVGKLGCFGTREIAIIFDSSDETNLIRNIKQYTNSIPE